MFEEKSRGVFRTQPSIYDGAFFVNILNGLLFSQYKLHHRCSTGHENVRASENIKIFKVKLSWSKSSRFLQRVAFLAPIEKVIPF